MRWLFLLLVISNGAVAFWGGWWNASSEVSASGAKPRSPVMVEGGLQLLSELAGDELARLEALKAARIKQGGEGDGPLCDLLGTFESVQKADYMVERLAALDVTGKVQELEVASGIRYWVYLSPEISKKEALRRLHELQAKGIDSYVIPKGELANGISFGLFNQQQGAVARQKEVKLLGYDASIKEVEHTHKEIWVLINPQDAENLDEFTWASLKKYESGIERRQNYCLGVASSKNIL